MYNSYDKTIRQTISVPAPNDASDHGKWLWMETSKEHEAAMRATLAEQRKSFQGILRWVAKAG